MQQIYKRTPMPKTSGRFFCFFLTIIWFAKFLRAQVDVVFVLVCDVLKSIRT